MNRTKSIQIATLLALILLAFPAFATKFIIEVSDFMFNPAALMNVKPGDTIRWEWVSGSHTTTSMSIPEGAATWDTPINSTSTFYEYVPQIPGGYSYKCTPHFSMGMVGAFSVNAVGIAEAAPVNVRLQVFPNPADQIVHVEAAIPGDGTITLTLLDARGSTVYSTRQEYSSGKLSAELDLAGLPSGNYFVRVTGNRMSGSRLITLR